jgi:hypothetical protein
MQGAGEERRSFYRVDTVARVACRRVDPSAEDAARMRVRARHVPSELGGALDESRIPPEERAALHLLERIAFAIDRLGNRLDALAQRNDANAYPVLGEPRAVSLSGSGFSCELASHSEPGALFEVCVDLLEPRLPLIHALASVVRQERVDGKDVSALGFEEIMDADRERIVQFAIRTQSLSLRERSGEER